MLADPAKDDKVAVKTVNCCSSVPQAVLGCDVLLQAVKIDIC